MKEGKANVVPDIFLDYRSSNSIKLEENLILANGDHASTITRNVLLSDKWIGENRTRINKRRIKQVLI